MTQSAQPRMAEGVIVLAAAALMALGLGGTVWWQSGRGAAPHEEGAGQSEGEKAGESERESAAESAAAAVLDARQALAEAEAEREAAETAARAAEDARIEAVARLELELEDARRQAATATAEKERLEAETERLKAEVEDLRQKVLQLVDELESVPGSGTTSAETNPGPEPRPEAVTAGPGRYEVSGRALNEARVVDANEELRYAVLDVGSAQGVRPGMQFSVLDGDEVVAQLRAEEVRENVSGMVVEPVAGARFPVPNDRAILSRYADR